MSHRGCGGHRGRDDELAKWKHTERIRTREIAVRLDLLASCANVLSLGQEQGDLGRTVQRYIIIINWDLSRLSQPV